MKAVVDRDLCIGCGTCEEICPEVFRLNDEGISEVIGSCDSAECCEEAMESCPASAISLED
ncbi:MULTISPECIES: ferredoxin [Archaeoglobus]|jgi:ferredoxin|uniref:Ferredoxin n=3 Tax=Archaeoglobus fulgidus TaxID=2234 RepID=O30071_ARCFU|nr:MULTISPECIES: ferredoxin [Archaeoglobus]AAB91062.1 ferredoxin (fdx-2) [Archaeoglobus fulgidus DSM 4304]AIG97001.1 Ferredoxin [Archaeoglobus fulgidus DSM 8774]KUJ93415.1 MAG: Ferredoxin (Fdx-2) [Archaeoglobus fulgidus]KUK06481.1 MAG: Ferredoxin (Fdx-2) [Archaeoglobus fulgidus]MDI3497693.1 ferredoxin [Archaeoglobus sp.]